MTKPSPLSPVALSPAATAAATRERARAWLAARATPGTPMLFTRRELAQGWPVEEAAALEEALASLVAAHQLWRLERGRTIFYLHAASLAPLRPARPRPASPPRARASRRAAASAPDARMAGPAEPARQRIHEAYRELARATGFSDVLISDLQKRAGVALAELQPWLVQESRAGRALPTRGDWSIADAEARAAAIEIGREPHLRVRLVETTKD